MNIGDKRKQRERKSREKVLRRRAALRKSVRETRKKDKMDYLSRRKSQPINNDKIQAEEQANMDTFVLDMKVAEDNLKKLQEMEAEMIKFDEERKKKQCELAEKDWQNWEKGMDEKMSKVNWKEVANGNNE